MLPDSPERRKELSDLRSVMWTAEGRRFMFRLIHKKCRVLSSTHSQCHADAAFLDGSRNVGLGLLADIDQACRELHILMLKEEMDASHIVEVEPSADE